MGIVTTGDLYIHSTKRVLHKLIQCVPFSRRTGTVALRHLIDELSCGAQRLYRYGLMQNREGW